MSELVTQQLDYLYFICGMAYFVLAVAALSIKNNAGSNIPWRWIMLFACLQSFACWFAAVSFSFWGNWIQILPTTLGNLALIVLIESGRRMGSLYQTTWRGTWFYAILLAPAITVAFFNTDYISLVTKAMLSIGSIIVTLPVMLKLAGSSEHNMKHYFVIAGILLICIIFFQPVNEYCLLLSVRQATLEQAPLNIMQSLLLSESLMAFIMAVCLRNIYNIYMRHKTGDKLKTGYKNLMYSVLVVIVALGFIVTAVLSSLWEKELKQDLITQASIAALSTDLDNVKVMTGTPADLITKEFQSIFEQQRRMAFANHNYRWTYLLLQKYEGIIILAGYEAPGNNQHAAVTVYKDAPTEIARVFATGEPVTAGPYSDSLGRWISALAPVVDSSTGEVVAVQGIDIPAVNYFDNLAIKRLTTIFSIWVLALFAIVYYYYDRTRREQLALVEQSETRYSAIVENSLDGILIIQDNHIKFINESASQIFGRDSADICRHIFTAYFHQDDHSMMLQRVKDRLAGKQLKPFTELRLVRPDGKIRYIETTGTVIDYEGHPADLTQIRDVTERKLAANALKDAHAKQESIIDSLPDATFVVDHERKIIAWNKAMVSLTGCSKEKMLGAGNYAYSVALYGTCRPSLIDVVFTEGNEAMHQYDGINKEGDMAYIEAFVPQVFSGKGAYMWGTASLLRDNGGNIVGAIETLRDISYRKELEQELQASNEKLKEWLGAAENRAQDIVLIGEMVQWIDSCDSFEEATKIAGHYLHQLFKGDNGFLAFVDPVRNILEANVVFGHPAGDLIFSCDECWGIRLGKLHVCDWQDDCQVCRHLGEDYKGTYVEVPLIAQGQPLGLLCIQYTAEAGIDDKESAAWLAVKREIVTRVAEPLSLALANTRLRSTLREQANRDPLTGLYNRRYMEEALDRELHRALREKRSIGFIMGDIDHFKSFNDQYGHEAGDMMLKAVASTIKSSIRSEDIACRFGGEEFLIILPSANLADTEERAHQIHAEVRKITFECGGNPIGNISISMGISAFPDHGLNHSALISAADMAMYRAKREGRDRVCCPE